MLRHGNGIHLTSMMINRTESIDGAFLTPPLTPRSCTVITDNQLTVASGDERKSLCTHYNFALHCPGNMESRTFLLDV